MATLQDPANATTLDSSTTSATLELFRAVLGPINTDYYLKAFTRFDAKDKAGPSWNWAAALLTLNWMALYRLWVAALAYVGVVVGGVLLLLGLGRLVFGLSDEALLVGLGLLAALAIAVPGVFGNALLYNACRKNMNRVLTESPTLAAACDMLRTKAPSRQRVIGLGLVNGALLAGVVGLGVAFQSFEPAALHGAVAGETTGTVATGAGAATAAGLAGGSVAGAGTPASPTASAPSNAASTSAASTTLEQAASAPAPASTASAPAKAASGLASQATSAQPQHSASAAANDHAIAAAVAAASASAQAEKAIEKATQKADATASASSSPKDRSANKRDKADSAKTAAKDVKESKTAKAKTPDEPAQKLIVNVGLFADENNARNAASKLSDAGIPVLVNEMESAKGKRTRVRAGPFSSQAEAERAVDKIHFIGLDAVIARK